MKTHLIHGRGTWLKDISAGDILFFPGRKTAEEVVKIEDSGIYANRFFKNNSKKRFDGLPYIKQRIFYEFGKESVMRPENGGETVDSIACSSNEEISQFERNINDLGIILGEYK